MTTKSALIVLAIMVAYPVSTIGHCQIIDTDNTPFDKDTWEDTFQNTPLDPDTWKHTIKGTPFDPQTWGDVLEALSDPDPLVSGCAQHATLMAERNGEGGRMPYAFKHYLRPWFGDLVDIVRIRWSANLNDRIVIAGAEVAVSSSAQTFGYTIYVRDEYNPLDAEQLILLAHEMLHAWQFREYGASIQDYCRAYMRGYFGSGMSYDANPIERYAFLFEEKFATWISQSHADSVTKLYPGSRRTIYIPEKIKPPAERYFVTNISNRWSQQVYYRISVDHGKTWYSYSVEPGSSRWHSVPVNPEQLGLKEMKIKFEAGGGRTTIYDLEMNRSYRDSDQEARNYHFEFKDGKLELYGPG